MIIATHDPFYPAHVMGVTLLILSVLIIFSFKFVIAMTGAMWCIALYAVD